ncbi:beta strand repeat-containing protein, partial [Flavobacterium granuli]
MEQQYSYPPGQVLMSGIKGITTKEAKCRPSKRRNLFGGLSLFLGLLLLFTMQGMAYGQIAQRGTATTATTTSPTLTITKPSGLAIDDLMIVQIVQGGTGNQINNPTATGWTLIAGSDIRSSNGERCRANLYYKKAGSADVSASNFSFTKHINSSNIEGAIIAFSGVNSTTPFDVTPGAVYTNIADDNALNASAIITVTANSAIIMFGAYNNDRSVSNWSIATVPAISLNELFTVPYNSTRDIGMGAAWALKSAIGSTGTGTAALNIGEWNGSLLVALRPAVASPTLTTGTLPAFGDVCPNTTEGPNSFTITGTNLTTANITVGALSGYTYSTTSEGTYTSSLSLTHAAGAYSQTIYVKFTPTLAQSYNGNIAVGGGGATSVNVVASGTGVNSPPTVTSPTSTAITTNTATLGGNITNIGCSSVTERGIYWSTTNGFADGAGTKVSVTPGPYSTGVFTVPVTGLSSSTVYYYKAFAKNSSGTIYTGQGTFTTANKTESSIIVTGTTNFTYNGLEQGPASSTVTGSTGAVSYSYSGTGSTTYVASPIQPINVGTYQVIATVTGDANYNAATSLALAFFIDKATPSATLAVSNSPTVYTGSAQSATVNITTSSVPGSVTSILTGGSATQTAASTYTVTASFVPNDNNNYNTLTGISVGNFVINKADALITVTPYSLPYDGNPHTSAFTAIGVESTPADLTALMDVSATTHTNGGTYTADVWSFAGNNNYNTANGTVDNAIGKIDATIVLTAFNGTYDGESHGVLSSSATGLAALDL